VDLKLAAVTFDDGLTGSLVARPGRRDERRRLVSSGLHSVRMQGLVLRKLKIGQEIERSSGSWRRAAGHLVVEWRLRSASRLRSR
jgi:hypothetical protein